MIDKSLRYNYQWGGPGGKSPGASSSGGGGHDRGGQQHQATAQAAVQAAKSQPVARSAPDPYRGGEVIVHTPPKTEYITKKEPVTPKDEIKNPFEETGQTKKEQAKIASDVQELRDKVKTYNQEFTPDLYVDLDKYMKDKGLYSSGDVKEKFEEDWDFENLKVKAPKTLAPPKKTYERGIPFLEDTLVKTVTPPKYSPT